MQSNCRQLPPISKHTHTRPRIPLHSFASFFETMRSFRSTIYVCGTFAISRLIVTLCIVTNTFALCFAPKANRCRFLWFDSIVNKLYRLMNAIRFSFLLIHIHRFLHSLLSQTVCVCVYVCVSVNLTFLFIQSSKLIEASHSVRKKNCRNHNNEKSEREREKWWWWWWWALRNECNTLLSLCVFLFAQNSLRRVQPMKNSGTTGFDGTATANGLRCYEKSKIQCIKLKCS